MKEPYKQDVRKAMVAEMGGGGREVYTDVRRNFQKNVGHKRIGL